MSNKISDSAFLVNKSRSRRVDISKDIYAYLWTNESTNKLWDEFNNQVYTYDEIELSLRNRFFLEQLKSFINKKSNPVFVNIASGFTSYPFIIKNPCTFIEIDLPNIIQYKQEKIKKWLEKEILPKREIIFISADICNRFELVKLKEFLSPKIKNNPSFFLLEGITYYLSMKNLNRLIKTISEIQTPNSIIAFDFWKHTNKNHPVFKRFSRFFAERFNFQEINYNFIDIDFIKKIPGYNIIELTDIQELEKRFTSESYLTDYKKILPENYVILGSY